MENRSLDLQGCFEVEPLPVVMLASTEVGTNPLTCRPFPSQHELARQCEPHGPRTDQPTTTTAPVGGCVTLARLGGLVQCQFMYVLEAYYVCTQYL